MDFREDEKAKIGWVGSPVYSSWNIKESYLQQLSYLLTNFSLFKVEKEYNSCMSILQEICTLLIGQIAEEKRIQLKEILGKLKTIQNDFVPEHLPEPIQELIKSRNDFLIEAYLDEASEVLYGALSFHRIIPGISTK